MSIVNIDLDLEAVADLLDKAANELDRNGWTQGALQSLNGMCAIGAINKAHLGGARYNSESSACDGIGDDVYDAAIKLMNQCAATITNGARPLIHTYNDFSETQKEDVTGLMRSAAQELRIQRKKKIFENENVLTD